MLRQVKDAAAIQQSSIEPSDLSRDSSLEFNGEEQGEQFLGEIIPRPKFL